MGPSDQRAAASPGQCWHFTEDPEPRRASHPLPCPEPVAVRGILRTAAGWGVPVESCAEHAKNLEDVQARINPGGGVE